MQIWTNPNKINNKRQHVFYDFNDIKDMQNWIDATEENAIHNIEEYDKYSQGDFNREVSRNPKFHGNTTWEECSRGITEFIAPNILERIERDVLRNLDTSKLKNMIVKKKLSFNDRSLGLFSYSRASQGLFRIKVYHSEIYNQDYYKDDVEQIDEQKFVLKQDNTPVTEQWQTRENGKPKVRTTIKKSFAYFVNKNTNSNAVEIILAMGGSSKYDWDKLIYSAVPGIVVAKILQEKGIKTQIYSHKTNQESQVAPNNKTYNSLIVPIKLYSQTLDTNILSIVTGDARFYRYTMAKAIISMNENLGLVSGNSYGYPINDSILSERILQPFFDMQSQQPKIRLYFGGTYTVNDCVRQINSSIEIISNLLSE